MGNALLINGLSMVIGEDELADDDGLALLHLGRAVDRASAVMAASPETIFNVVGGPCMITHLYGRVEVAIQGQATTLVLANDPTGAVAAANLAASTDINGDAVGTLLLPTGLPTDVMVEATAGGAMARPMIVQPGIINLTYGAVSTGELSWHLRYIPLVAGASIEAA